MSDKRDCPKCNVRMEYKHALESGDFGFTIFQCPNCKNIEVIMGS